MNGIERALGKVEGKLDGLDDKMDIILDGQIKVNERIDGLDARLRKVETKSAVMGTIGGALAGSVMGGLAVLIKAKLGG